MCDGIRAIKFPWRDCVIWSASSNASNSSKWPLAVQQIHRSVGSEFCAFHCDVISVCLSRVSWLDHSVVAVLETPWALTLVTRWIHVFARAQLWNSCVSVRKKSYSNDFVPCRRVQNQTRIATTVRSVSSPRGRVCQFNVKSQNLCIDRTNLTFLCMLDF